MTSSSRNETKEERKSETKTTSSNSNFTIEHILNRAGSNNVLSSKYQGTEGHGNISGVPFPWLHCTRYCPPKIPRNQKKEGPQKRQLGRHPRIPFTSHQLSVLEEKFQQSPYLSSEEVTKLSRILELADIRVKIWFQNRRARERRERTGTVDTGPQSQFTSSGPESAITTTKTKTNVECTKTFNENSSTIQDRVTSPAITSNFFVPATFTVLGGNSSSCFSLMNSDTSYSNYTSNTNT